MFNTAVIAAMVFTIPISQILCQNCCECWPCKVSLCFHSGVRTQHSQELPPWSRLYKEMLINWLIPLNRMSARHLLGGSSWHRQFCWAFAGKTLDQLSGDSCREYFLSVLTVSHCHRTAARHSGSVRRAPVTTPGVN